MEVSSYTPILREICSMERLSILLLRIKTISVEIKKIAVIRSYFVFKKS